MCIQLLFFDESLHKLEDVAECKNHNSDSNTLSYIFFKILGLKLKKLCVSGYPTMPNCLHPTLFF